MQFVLLSLSVSTSRCKSEQTRSRPVRLYQGHHACHAPRSEVLAKSSSVCAACCDVCAHGTGVCASRSHIILGRELDDLLATPQTSRVALFVCSHVCYCIPTYSWLLVVLLPRGIRIWDARVYSRLFKRYSWCFHFICPFSILFSGLHVQVGREQQTVRVVPRRSLALRKGLHVFVAIRRFLLHELSSDRTCCVARYGAVNRTIKRLGFRFLVLIRFAPFPFAGFNCILAAIPAVQTWQFLAATMISEVCKSGAKLCCHFHCHQLSHNCWYFLILSTTPTVENLD